MNFDIRKVVNDFIIFIYLFISLIKLNRLWWEFLCRWVSFLILSGWQKKEQYRSIIVRLFLSNFFKKRRTILDLFFIFANNFIEEWSTTIIISTCHLAIFTETLLKRLHTREIFNFCLFLWGTSERDDSTTIVRHKNRFPEMFQVKFVWLGNCLNS